jgi:hypothetical protein
MCTCGDTEHRKISSQGLGTALAENPIKGTGACKMERTAYHLDELDEADEFINDRIPGMPLLGFFTGTVLSLAIWGAVAFLALTV